MTLEIDNFLQFVGRLPAKRSTSPSLRTLANRAASSHQQRGETCQQAPAGFFVEAALEDCTQRSGKPTLENRNMPSNSDLRQQTTASIIDAIENKNLLPWRRPWASGKDSGRHRNVLGRAYSGINPLLLEIHADKHGLTSRTWGTYNQWASLGLQVKKRPDHVKAGAWGGTVVLYRPSRRRRSTRREERKIDDRFLVARQFVVFEPIRFLAPVSRSFSTTRSRRRTASTPTSAPPRNC